MVRDLNKLREEWRRRVEKGDEYADGSDSYWPEDMLIPYDVYLAQSDHREDLLDAMFVYADKIMQHGWCEFVPVLSVRTQAFVVVTAQYDDESRTITDEVIERREQQMFELMTHSIAAMKLSRRCLARVNGISASGKPKRVAAWRDSTKQEIGVGFICEPYYEARASHVTDAQDMYDMMSAQLDVSVRFRKIRGLLQRETHLGGLRSPFSGKTT